MGHASSAYRGSFSEQRFYGGLTYQQPSARLRQAIATIARFTKKITSVEVRGAWGQSSRIGLLEDLLDPSPFGRRDAQHPVSSACRRGSA